MAIIDWIIMIGTLVLIGGYGMWYTRKRDTMSTYLKGDQNLKWYTIGLSIMATQASAITFLSTPGQAYMEGMGFLQFYFGLPLAMVVLSVFVVPIFYRLNVYTAYEYLENRFDWRVRSLAAILFLIQRGLAAGLTIYAPAIILSSILGWSLGWTVLLLGGIVIIYTVWGGSDAVSVTQQQQMTVMLLGLFVALFVVIWKLPAGIGFGEAMTLAGNAGKLNIVDFEFDFKNKYNIWSGLIASCFLFMSYFGTDQSQVQRYLSGKSLTESRMGLMFNGLIKIPMQFIVLLTGVMVFVFFQWEKAPLNFNAPTVLRVQNSEMKESYRSMENELVAIQANRQTAIKEWISTKSEKTLAEIKTLNTKEKELRNSSKEKMKAFGIKSNETKDTDYVFIHFVLNFLPVGIIGLLLAVILCAAMSSTASELNALATTTMVDFYKRHFRKSETDIHYYKASVWISLTWGMIILGMAMVVSLFENLIQAVNIIGSLFYGTILGIFLTAFFVKKVSSGSVLFAGFIAEILVVLVYFLAEADIIPISYLWLNLIGCLLVMGLSYSIEFLTGKMKFSHG
jgi:solute:Na+ symporter, SSS family